MWLVVGKHPHTKNHALVISVAQGYRAIKFIRQSPTNSNLQAWKVLYFSKSLTFYSSDHMYHSILQWYSCQTIWYYMFILIPDISYTTKKCYLQQKKQPTQQKQQNIAYMTVNIENT